MSEPDDAALDALDAYVDKLLAGEPADERALLEAHPELAEELELVSSLHRAADSVAIDASENDAEAAPPGPERLIPAGEVLGECVIEELIGAGGMGEVYRATHQVLGREVAVKVLRPSLADQPDAMERFRKEVQAQAKVGAHPHVVTALHASEHDGRLYLVMERVDGTDLRQLVRREGPLPPREACALIRQAALGIAHAHRAGIVHRDIKPSNLLVTEDGLVKVVDLGLADLARRAPRDDADGAWVDELVGSLDYMAPEQADRPEEADERSDLYALGCTLYFLIEGRAPFADRLALKKLMAHAVDPPPALSRPVPAAVQRVLSELLAKSPDDRPASAEALVEAIDDALEADAPSARRSTQVPAPTARGPWRAIAIGALIALALVLAGGVALWLRPESASELKVDGAVAGALETGDETGSKDGVLLDAYPVQVQAGHTYAWTLHSRSLDPVLRLRARLEEGGTWELGTNDDAPGMGLSSQLVWTADRTGEVEVVATTLRPNERGAYVLSMEELSRPELSVGENVRGALTEDDAVYFDRTRIDYFWLRVTHGETYVIQMRGDGYAPFLLLESDTRDVLAAVAPDEASPEEARMVYVAEQSGVVYLGANARLPGEGGDYELSVRSELLGDLVLSVEGQLSEEDPTLRDGSNYEPHPLTVRAGHTYVITMTSEEFDAFLLLDDAGGRHVARNDDADGTNSRIVFHADADAEMTVLANSYVAAMSGAYTLTALELAP